MTISYKKIISTFLVIVLAVFTGFAIGKIYLDGNKTLGESNYTFAEVHASKEMVEDLYKQSLEKNITDFTPKELYLIAEYKLSIQNFKIETTGFIDSGVMGISAKVDMRSVKTKVDDKIVYSKYSPSKSIGPVNTPKICKQFTYDLSKKGFDGKPYINIVEGDFISTGPNLENIDGIFTEEGENWSQEDYIEQFKALPNESILPYIISDITYNDNPDLVYDSENEVYKFEIVLSGHNVLSDATLSYSREISYTCGYKNAHLTWKNSIINVAIDNNFNFKSIDYNEFYTLFAEDLPMRVKNADVNDKFFSVFTYGDEVTL